MTDKIDLLDYGFVRLVDSMGDDMSIVRAARVSYDAEPRGDGSDEKLINYLMKNRHTSPFEAVEFTFEVKAPIFVFRQWHRHRTWSYNEVSARYTALPDEFYVPHPSQIGEQSKTNKQMRIDTGEATDETIRAAERIEVVCRAAHDHYKILLDQGVPRELARSVLPLATYSRMFATVDLHNLFHFLRLRLHEHSQYEIRVYAEAILQLISPEVPAAVAAFKESMGYETDEASQSD